MKTASEKEGEREGGTVRGRERKREREGGRGWESEIEKGRERDEGAQVWRNVWLQRDGDNGTVNREGTL